MWGFVPHGRFAGIFLGVVLLAVSACSVQKPDSRLDSSKSGEKVRPESRIVQQQPPRENEPVRVNYLTLVSDISSPEIYVYKEKRRLYVIQSNVMVRDYPIGLGFSPVGDKERDGDGRTPEGDFVVCRKDAASSFHKALVLNYPDRKHAERALFAGIITPPEFREIIADAELEAKTKETAGSKAYPEQPPRHTKLGGRLYIHAGGAHKDWTQGAIALYGSDMDELFKIASTGTPVHIRP